MPADTLLPEQWVAALNMAARRGESVTIKRIQVEAWQLQLADGTPWPYNDASGPRAFRSPEQAYATLASFGVTVPAIIDKT